MIKILESVIRKINYDERFHNVEWIIANFPRVVNCDTCPNTGAINMGMRDITIPLVNITVTPHLITKPTVEENKICADIEEFETNGVCMSGHICADFNMDNTITLTLEWGFCAPVPKMFAPLAKPFLKGILNDHLDRFIKSTGAEVI